MIYRKQFGDWLVRNSALVARMVVLLSVTAFAFGARQIPDEVFVQQVLLLVQPLGMAVIIASVLFNAVRVIIEPEYQHSMTGVMTSLAAYAVALWLIGKFGDEVYRYALANPNMAQAAAVAVVICWVILCCGAPLSTSKVVAFESAAVAGSSIRSKITARDTQYIAAHEAGHALTYAALGGLPYDVRVVVNEQADSAGVLGLVTGIGNPHRLEEKSFVEWYMHVLLAGTLGETIMHCSSTLGSTGDHRQWLAAARSFLANQYRGIYYTEPQSKFEQEHNEAKLEALRAEQLATLRKLFDLNAQAYRQLVNALLEKRALSRDDLIAILERVVLPEGFPLPFGSFARFERDWPRSNA